MDHEKWYDPSSLYELSSTTESDFESDSALVSTPGTSTELEMEQEIDTRPIGPPSHKQQKGWMHLSSESESDGKMRRGPSCVKFYEREKKLQRLRSLDLHLPGE